MNLNYSNAMTSILLVAVTGALILLMVGCGGGASVSFRPGAAYSQVRLDVTIQGAGNQFPAGLEWSDPPGPPTTVTPLGNDRFRLQWDFDNVTNAEFKATVTGNAPGNITVNRAEVRNLSGDWIDIRRSRLRVDGSGIEVAKNIRFENPEDNDVLLYVSHAELAVTAEPIAPEQLTNGDPLIESLPWMDFTGPFELMPGQDVEFDLPLSLDDLPPGYSVLLRYDVYDPEGGFDNPMTVYWHNTGLATVACPADLDGDGVVGVSDMLILLSAWGPCDDAEDGCFADLTGDGKVGIGDLLTLLSQWGVCQ